VIGRAVAQWHTLYWSASQRKSTVFIALAVTLTCRFFVTPAELATTW
jgi:hypothetical protein